MKRDDIIAIVAAVILGLELAVLGVGQVLLATYQQLVG